MLNLKNFNSLSLSKKISINTLSKFSFCSRKRQNAFSNKLKLKNTITQENENSDIVNKTKKIQNDLLNEIKNSKIKKEEIKNLINHSLKLINNIEHNNADIDFVNYGEMNKNQNRDNFKTMKNQKEIELQKTRSNIDMINKNLASLYYQMEKDHGKLTKLKECENIIRISKGVEDPNHNSNTNTNINSNNIPNNNNYNQIHASISEKKNNVNFSHIAEMRYFEMPFAHQYLNPYKYMEPFFGGRPENNDLKIEFEHEEELLNEETSSIIKTMLNKEMKDFKLNDIKSNTSIFNDPVKNQDPVSYLLPESNRDIDYDLGTEVDRLYFVVNKEDDFGVTMYKDEGEKKKPKESIDIRDGDEVNQPMTNRRSFPFVVDQSSFTLLNSNIRL
jgi:hypothetical protein